MNEFQLQKMSSHDGDPSINLLTISAFELFIAEENKNTIKPSDLLKVFLRLGLDGNYSSCTDMLMHIIDETGD